MSVSSLTRTKLTGVCPTSRGAVIAELARAQPAPVWLVIAEDLKTAEHVAEDLAFFHAAFGDSRAHRALVFPESMTDNRDMREAFAASSDRLTVLSRLRAVRGMTTTPDTVVVVTTPAEGRRIQQLWTTREFPDDFTLKLEFRATPNADSGVFIRQPQLQCRDYPLAGPYKDLKRYRAQDWNELVVTVRGGVARAECNGELLTDNFKVPATGGIGLEGDRGQMEYRRIRVGPPSQ